MIETIKAINQCDEIVDVTEKSYRIRAVNDSTDIITLHGDVLMLQTGDRVHFTGSNLPAPISLETDYYVIVYQRNTTPRIKIASTLQNAIDGVAINLTTAGIASTNRRIVLNGEPRYHGGGVVKTTVELGQNLSEIMSGMGGRAIFAGGKYLMITGAYRQPEYYFDESDIVSGISVSTKKSKQDRFNRVKGLFTSPINNGNPSDYPVVKNDFYQSEDGEQIEKDLTLPFTQRATTAQRLAKIELERQRQEIVFAASFNMRAFKVMAGDNIFFTFERYGWVNKVFEIIEWSLGFDDNDGVPTPVINMTLQENASQVYDWNFGEETSYDYAPNTILPSPFIVQPVTGLSIDSFLVSTQAGDKTYKVVVSWDLHISQFVTQGGVYEVEFKRSAESSYKSAGKVDGDVAEINIPQLQPDIYYDIRIRAYNNIGVASNYTTIYGYKVGDSTSTQNEDWEFTTETRNGADLENDTAATENWE